MPVPMSVAERDPLVARRLAIVAAIPCPGRRCAATAARGDPVRRGIVHWRAAQWCPFRRWVLDGRLSCRIPLRGPFRLSPGRLTRTSSPRPSIRRTVPGGLVSGVGRTAWSLRAGRLWLPLRARRSLARYRLLTGTRSGERIRGWLRTPVPALARRDRFVRPVRPGTELGHSIIVAFSMVTGFFGFPSAGVG